MVIRLLRWSAGTLGVLGLLVALLLLIGPAVDLEPIRNRIEEELSAAIGNPSTIRSAKLRIAAPPEIVLSGVAITRSVVHEERDFLRVALLRARIALLPLLRHKIRIVRARAEGIEVLLPWDAGGDGSRPTDTGEDDWVLTGIDDLVFERIRLGFSDPTSEIDREIEVDRLELAARTDSPLGLDASGRFEESPWKLGLSGGTLSQLADRGSWPFTLRLHSEPASLQMEGRGDLSAGLDAEFQLASTTPLGMAQLHGSVAARNGALSLTDLEAVVGEMQATGDLSVTVEAERPRIDGSLALDRIMVPPAGSETPFDGPDVETAPEPETPLAAVTLLDVVKLLQSFDGRLAVTVAEVGEAPASLRLLELHFELTEGHIMAPFTFELGGSAVSGAAEMVGLEVVELTLEAESSEFSLASIEGFLEDPPVGLEGRLGSLSLLADAKGVDLASLLESLRLQARARGVRIATSGPEPVALRLESVTMHHRDRRLEVAMEGDLRSVPFDLDLATTVSLGAPMDSREWPFEIGGTTGGAIVELQGTWDPMKQTARLDFNVAGDSIAGLAPWLGVSERAELPFAVEGAFSTVASHRTVDLTRLEVGRSLLDAALSWDDDTDEGLLSGRVHATTLDPAELSLLTSEVITAEEEAVGVDLPLLTEPLPVGNAEVSIAVDRILRESVGITDLRAGVIIHSGRLDPSSFDFSLGEADVSGTIALDPSHQPAELALDLQATDLDLGQLLAEGGLLQEFDLTAERIAARLAGRGTNLGEMLEDLEIEVVIDNARSELPIGAVDRRPVLSMNATMMSSPGSDLTLSSRGTLGELPLEIDLTIGRRSTGPAGAFRHPARLIVRAAENTLRIEEDISPPFDADEVEFDIVLEGPGIDGLGQSLEADLPAVGAYRLAGRFRAAEGIYTLSDFDLRIGQSDLTGRAALDTTGARPLVIADLDSKQLDLSDFSDREGPSDMAGESEELEEVEILDEAPTRTARSDDSRDREIEPSPADVLPSRPDWMKEFDARLTLDVEELVAGSMRLGRLSFETALEDQRLDLALDVSDPGGSEGFQLQLAEHGDLVSGGLRTRVEGFDYAELLGAIDPGHGSQGGLLSFDVGIEGEAATWTELPQVLDGHVDFTLYPRGASSRILDLWAASLARAMVSKGEPVINCIVGRFDVVEGVLATDNLYIDTSRIRARGRGTIDLFGNDVTLKLKPRPKKPSFVNLATPAIVEGGLDDPSVHLSKTGLVKTFFRVSMWFYTAYLELMRKPLPADGSDICLDPVPRSVVAESP